MDWFPSRFRNIVEDVRLIPKALWIGFPLDSETLSTIFVEFRKHSGLIPLPIRKQHRGCSSDSESILDWLPSRFRNIIEDVRLIPKAFWIGCPLDSETVSKMFVYFLDTAAFGINPVAIQIVAVCTLSIS
jgi:hypothetical protein